MDNTTTPLFYTNHDASEQMLVVVTAETTRVRVHRDDAIVLDCTFDQQQYLVGQPVGTLVDMLRQHGFQGKNLTDRLLSFYHDKQQILTQRTLLDQGDDHGEAGSFEL